MIYIQVVTKISFDFDDQHPQAHSLSENVHTYTKIKIKKKPIHSLLHSKFKLALSTFDQN